MTACVFCGILRGEEPASFVAADDRVVAFTDILPVGPGHTLVVPRRHAVGLHDLDPDDAGAMMRLGQRIASAQRRAGLADGVNLFLADGVVAGQEVFHAHLHVLPRLEDDALRLHVDYRPPPSRGTLDGIAARLRAELDGGRDPGHPDRDTDDPDADDREPGDRGTDGGGTHSRSG